MKNTIQILFLFLLSAILTSCNKQESPDTSHNNLTKKKQNTNSIQISPEAFSSMNIKSIKVQELPGNLEIKTTGGIAPNENKVFHISSFTAGKVVQDNIMLGDIIKTGQVLALVQNQDVAKIYSDFIHQYHQNEVDIKQSKIRLKLADQTLKREQDLLAEGVSPRKNYQQAFADQALAKANLEGLEEHRQHLKSEVNALLSVYNVKVTNPNSERVISSSPILASKSGIIIKKNITLGDIVGSDTPLYVAADLSNIWLNARIYSQDISKISLGDRIEFTTDSLIGQVFKGQIDYINPSIDDLSKTYTARINLDNSLLKIKPGMSGQIIIKLSKIGETKPFVPESAIQDYQDQKFVFINSGKGKFKKQNIELGTPINQGFLVEKGLKAGEEIITEGSFLLKAELLKGSQEEEE